MGASPVKEKPTETYPFYYITVNQVKGNKSLKVHGNSYAFREE